MTNFRDLGPWTVNRTAPFGKSVIFPTTLFFNIPALYDRIQVRIRSLYRTNLEEKRRKKL